jgi:DNA polymerase-3 subunit delta'
MPFSEIVGQDRAVGSLRAALRRGALHHALLLAGPPGVGKGTAARILAQALNCERPGRAQGQPDEAAPERAGGLGGRSLTAPPHVDDGCGECGPCRKIARGLHPDVLLVEEERVMARSGRWEPRGGRAPSRDIVVDQIRDLVDRRLALKRFEGRCRVVIIDPADAMNPQAQNALLKTLEEPPGDTVLALVASAPDALLPTVRSRCLRLTFAPLPDDLVAARLAAAGRPPEEARLAAALAVGSLGRALGLDAEALRSRRQAALAAAGLPRDDAGAWIAFARQAGEDREAARETCELLLVFLRDVLVLQAAGSDPRPALADLGAAARAAAAALSPGEVLRRIAGVRQALGALRQNAAAALALERMLIGWFHG